MPVARLRPLSPAAWFAPLFAAPLFAATLFAALLAGALPTAAAAALRVDAEPAPGWLRLPLDEPAWRALAGAHPRALQAFGPEGREQPLALCVPAERGLQAGLEVPVLAAPRGAQPVVGADGSARLRLPPGVRAQPPYPRLILDLRGLPGRVAAVELDPALAGRELTLRSSPNLEQWSLPLALRRSGGKLLLVEPLPTSWMALDLSPGLRDVPPAMGILLQQDRGQRPLQWFTLPTDAQGVADNPRALPIRGARPVGAPAQLGAMRVDSRLDDGDAWKSRGGWRAGQGPAEVGFAAVGDGQWRLRAEPEDLALRWQLAHDALELRLPAGTPLPLRLEVGAARRPPLSCDDGRWAGPARTLALEADGSGPGVAPADDAPRNLRPAFLLLLAVAALLWAIWRRRRA